MRIIQLQPCAEAIGRRVGVCVRHEAIPVACAILFTIGGCYAQAAENPTYKLLGREAGGYTAKDDLPAIVARELGPRGAIADWDEIKSRYGGSEAALRAFCDGIGLGPNASAFVTQGGKGSRENGRRCFVYRADHKLPDNFTLQDQLQENFLLLGSGHEARPVVVKIQDYNASDAAKWVKWDALLATKDKTVISGVYELVKIGGNKVPAKISHDGAVLEIRAGAFTISADGQCKSKMTFVPPSGVESTLERKATYSREGPRLNMQWQGAGRTQGTVEGNTFTMENEGMVLVYQKLSSGDAKPAP
jgi:hypothetical protein